MDLAELKTHKGKLQKLGAIYLALLVLALVIVAVAYFTNTHSGGKLEDVYAGFNETLTTQELHNLILAERDQEQSKEQQYEDVIAQIATDNPNKEISLQDENDIQRNLPKGVLYYELKNRLLELGFKFIGFESSFSLPTSKSHTAEIKTIVEGLKTKYPDLQISIFESSDIRNNLPSYILYSDVKDEMIKQGFEFQ